MKLDQLEPDYRPEKEIISEIARSTSETTEILRSLTPYTPRDIYMFPGGLIRPEYMSKMLRPGSRESFMCHNILQNPSALYFELQVLDGCTLEMRFDIGNNRGITNLIRSVPKQPE